jgi:cystathionine gamma-synthase
MLKSVTSAINDAHRNKVSTYGDPRFYPRYGFPLVPSLQFSAAYSFDSAENLIAYHEHKYAGQRYCRDSNEAVTQLERYFDTLYPGCRSLMFNSGMGAVAASIDALCPRHGKVYVTRETYRKTLSYLDRISRTRELEVVKFTTAEDCAQKIREGEPGLVVLESPTNPHLDLHDFERIADLKDQHGLKVLADISLAGLCNVDFDFSRYDATTHSCTKYISGHNDLLGGVVMAGSDGIFEEIWNIRSERGGLMDPMSAYLLLRSLRTYDMRVARQVQNANQVIDHLMDDPRLVRLYHPSRQGGEERRVFEKYYSHGGSMVSFVADLDARKTLERLGQMHSVKMAPSFGAIDTLIEVPAVMSHYDKSPAQLEAMGLEPNLIRMSIGCEPMTDLLRDLDFLLSNGH